MKGKLIAVVGILFLLFGLASNVWSGTRDECISKCKDAAEFVKSNGVTAAVKEISGQKNRFVWNNGISYVFLMDMNCKVLAHPFNPELTKLSSLIDLKDVNGKAFFVDFINTAKKGKGWTKYHWTVPGKDVVKPKHTFIYRVPDTDYFVGAGFYVLAPGEFY